MSFKLKKLVLSTLIIAICSSACPINVYGSKCSMEEYRLYKADDYTEDIISKARQDVADDIYSKIMEQKNDHIMLYYYSSAEYKALLKNITACQEMYFYYSPFKYAEVSLGKNKGYITINTASARKYRGYTKNLVLNIPKLVDKAGVSSDTDELTAAKKIHDYIKKKYKYDYTEKSNHAFLMVNKKKGVCTAYSELFMYMCNYCGLRCEIVHSKKLNHAWNRVMCNGTWYYCDVTWDDTGKTSEYRLKTKKSFYRDKKHKGASTYEYIKVELE